MALISDQFLYPSSAHCTTTTTITQQKQRIFLHPPPGSLVVLLKTDAAERWTNPPLSRLW